MRRRGDGPDAAARRWGVGVLAGPERLESEWGRGLDGGLIGAGQLSAVFTLRKWYLDCTSARGDAFIGYSARLRWGGLRLGYASALLAAAGADPVETHTFFPGLPPWGRADRLRWRCGRLGVAAGWRARAGPVRRLLLGQAEAGIEWECVAPAAAARVLCPAGRVSGLGYAERLTLTLEPWRLPFHTLHWGRFLSRSASLVWIVWEGKVEARLLLRDSQPCGITDFSPDRIALEDGGVLLLARERVLRGGPIVSPALHSVARLARRLPPTFLAAREEKWLSHGCLELPGSPPATGWAIHELVRLG